MAATFWIALFLAPITTPQRPDEARKSERPALAMSKAILCKRVNGYEDYVELPDATLTSADKLNIYFRPLNYRIEPVEKTETARRYRASFREDARLRRKGQKAVLMKKDNVLEYSPTFASADEKAYLYSNISLKGLDPGDYEIDLVLRDGLEEGASATQTIAFTIVPIAAVEPDPKSEGTPEPEKPVVPTSDPKKPKPTKAKTKAKARP